MFKKIYYLVRHAEKQDPADNDTPISAIGRDRAEALKNTLINRNINHIIVSQYLRTKQTAMPLSVAIHINETEIALDNNHVNANVALVKTSLNQFNNSLVVGHTDNIPAIIRSITGKIVSIPSDDFDNLFIITIKDYFFYKKIRLTKTTYGRHSP